MDREQIDEILQGIFEPEPDEDDFYREAPPHQRLWDVHRIDTSYWKPHEFGSMSAFSRLVTDASDPINKATQSLSAPMDLFTAGLRLFGDSILAYCKPGGRRMDWGPLRYYPPVLMTFWAGFEAFVRLYSEVLVHTVSGIPSPARMALLETEEYVDRHGLIRDKDRPRPILERYWLLLKYGYDLDYDRGCKIWQDGERVARIRNGFVHYEVTEAPSLRATELWSFLEAVTLLLISPSGILRRSVCPSQYDLYWALVEIKTLIEEFEERPVHKGWPFSGYLFPCSFKGIDETKYPPGGRFPMPKGQDGKGEEG